MKMIRKTIQGFSLLEVIIVLFVITIGLVSVLSLITQNITSQRFNKEGIIAYQLSQEGVELIREVRDSNWRANNSFNDNLAPGNYYMDYLDSIPHSTDSNPQPLYLNSDSFYVHASSNNTSTKFSRLINISDYTPSSIKVLSEVVWSDKDVSHSYSLETILYDWR